MIESISIKNVATFDINGAQITDLQKVNFIYGANGCGKTTISNYLYDTTNKKFAHCSYTWKNSQVFKVEVYNKEFRERNFGNGKLGGVFTLGEATAEDLSIIEEKKLQLKSIQADILQNTQTLASQKEERIDLESEFIKNSWSEIYKKYETIFKEAFVGSMKSGLFKNKLLEEFENNTEMLQSFEDLKEKSQTIFGETPQNISPINEVIFGRIIEIENNQIWKKIIIGKADVDIAQFIQKNHHINDWVDQGRDYLQKDSTCPFCQEPTITDNFKSQLESFFDKAYLENKKLIKDLKQEYNSLVQNLINELNLIETTHRNFKGTKLNFDKNSSYLKTLVSQNSVNEERLNNKAKEPSRIIELVSLQEQLDLIANLIISANDEIKIHNGIVDNFQVEKNNLKNSIWKFITEEFREKITTFKNKNNGLGVGINTLQQQLNQKKITGRSLDNDIKNLNKNVTSIQPTVDKINLLLGSYGFLNFTIQPTEEVGFYQIQRKNGDIAESTLSEGEITFITFLYFLQLAEGGTTEENVNEEKILIVDDPISSLDSNVLFVVSTLIKKIIKSIKADNGNIKQIIVLTHNVYFHKELSFMDGKNRKCNKTNFWILRKNDSTTNIESFLESNPIQSSYELLWRELNSKDINSSITIQNVMRRIIENYFKLLGKYGDDDLIKKFEKKEEQEICRSLICWINDGSHSINDDLYIEQPTNTIDNYKKVFKAIFDKTNHGEHYNMMMGRN